MGNNQQTKIITNKDSEAMFPTTRTFIQQPKPQAGRTHDEIGAYQLEAHKVTNARALFPLKTWSL